MAIPGIGLHSLDFECVNGFAKSRARARGARKMHFCTPNMRNEILELAMQKVSPVVVMIIGHKKNQIISIYYSNFDKHKCTYFHWAQCNEPTTLTLDNLRCFSLISTKLAVVVATAFSYRFKC